MKIRRTEKIMANCRRTIMMEYFCETLREFRHCHAVQKAEGCTFWGCIDDDFFHEQWVKRTTDTDYIIFIKMMEEI